MHLPHQVFVYGTLKSGEPNFHVMSETDGIYSSIGKGRTLHTYPLIIASPFNVPMVIFDRGNGHRIHGEVYQVNDVKLAELDKLECHPDDYRREIEQIELEDGTVINAWMYSVRDVKPEIFEGATAHIELYTSAGEHGRPYNASYTIGETNPEYEFKQWLKQLKH
ncbi:unnamed protein product, partial [Mesorhabditis spiculigera]